jgi:hypothetical protein
MRHKVGDDATSQSQTCIHRYRRITQPRATYKPVVEFVRQLEINEKWKKSTIDAQDPRMEAAKLRARAEKILAMKEARANETETTNAQ